MENLNLRCIRLKSLKQIESLFGHGDGRARRLRVHLAQISHDWHADDPQPASQWLADCSDADRAFYGARVATLGFSWPDTSFKTMNIMAKQKRKKRIFSHARMVTIETILLVGLMQVWFEEWLVAQANLPGWLKIVTLMVIMIGILGFLLVSIEQLTKKSLAHAHDVVKNVPFPWYHSDPRRGI